ncbi:MAG: 7-cyano-7-deazaguanine synthase QueC [Gammaproteobacteria bacterium]|nr:7-cyano-7-deazaguanine synthase QueC [Gammaproteobacteria bacterium]
MKNKKAIVLLSGGLDSTTVLALAKSSGFQCYTMSFDYGQRHRSELNQAQKIASSFGVVGHKVFNIDLASFGGSALTDGSIGVPEVLSEGIPVTYVPARNTVFLSLALAWAEVLGSADIFIGVNAVDYSGYPDCRPEYIDAFERMANLATKSAIDGCVMTIHTPLIALTKAEILQKGMALEVDYSQTVSCYQADSDGRACGKCDSCRLRKQGFADANLEDVTRYL